MLQTGVVTNSKNFHHRGAPYEKRRFGSHTWFFLEVLRFFERDGTKLRTENSIYEHESCKTHPAVGYFTSKFGKRIRLRSFVRFGYSAAPRLQKDVGARLCGRRNTFKHVLGLATPKR